MVQGGTALKLYLELKDDGNTFETIRALGAPLLIPYPNHGSNHSTGVPRGTIQATVQDTALALAASIRRNFDERFPRNRYPRLTREQHDIYESLMSPQERS